MNFDNIKFDEMMEIEVGDGFMPPREEGPSQRQQEEADVTDPNKKEDEVDPNLIEVNESKEDDKDDKTGDEVKEDDSTKEHSPSSGGNDETDDSPSSLPLTVLIKALYEKGILSDISEEEIDKRVEGGADESDLLFDMMEGEVMKQVDIYRDSLPPKIKTLIEKYEENVPLDELLQIKSEQMRLDNIEESALAEDVDLQRSVIKADLKEKGFSDKVISRRLGQFEELSSLEEEATDALESLKTTYTQREKDIEDNAKQAEKDRVDQNDRMIKEIETNVYDTTEIIAGIPINDNMKKKIYESMTKPVGVDGYGNAISSVVATRNQNPADFEKALHYYHAIGLFNIDKRTGKIKPDISKIEKVARTSAVDTLNKSLKKDGLKETGGKPSKQVKQDDDKIKKNLDGLKSFLNS